MISIKHFWLAIAMLACVSSTNLSAMFGNSLLGYGFDNERSDVDLSEIFPDYETFELFKTTLKESGISNVVEMFVALSATGFFLKSGLFPALEAGQPTELSVADLILAKTFSDYFFQQ